MAEGDKYHLTLVAQLDKVSIANIFYIDVVDDDGAPNDTQEIHNEFKSNIVSKIKALQSSNVEYECTLIRKVSPTSEPAYMYTLNDVGALGTGNLPANLTMCVNTWAEDGRPYQRGRWFFSGMLETAISDGRWTQSTATSWATFLTTIPLTWGQPGLEFRLTHWSEALEEFYVLKRGRLAAIPRKLRNRTPGLCSIS
jgi:hypothetical protein